MKPLRIAAIDLGSNSFHLLVVQARPDGAFVTLTTEREMLRLGDAVGASGRIPPALADEVVAAVRRLRALADAHAADEVIACATSALREADNGPALVDRIADETGVRVRVISGHDEAELIFSAIQKSVLIEPGPAVGFDLGGGSLEVMVGDAAESSFLASVKLGVGRLVAELACDDPLTNDDVRRIRRRLEMALGPIVADVRDLKPQMAIGTSGTILSLARMIAVRRGETVPRSLNQFRFTRRELEELSSQLVALPGAERRRLAGLDEKRVDQAPIGSLVVLGLLDLFDFDSMVTGEWALREGIVLDAISRHQVEEWDEDPRGLRRRSVVDLARRCGWNEAHSRHVAALGLSLFDQLVAAGLLDESDESRERDRELLEFAALLHDIGEHVSQSSHHKHAAYLVEHGGLRGFTPVEVVEIACIARYHRRSEPKATHLPYAQLDRTSRARVDRLSAVLRVADGLDRTHLQVVPSVVLDDRGDVVELVVGHGADVAADCELEVWGARRKLGPLQNIIGRPLEVVGPTRDDSEMKQE